MTRPLRDSRRLWIGVALAALVALVLTAVWYLVIRGEPEEYATFVEPGGDYRVVVLRYPIWPAVMPGQAGDAPGIVRLVDREGNVLREVDVEMVQLVEEVIWEDDRVFIKAVVQWELPDRGSPEP